MLTPISRFRYNKTYLYGSTAFIVGYAGVLGLLFHYTPVRVPDANVAIVSTPQKAQTETVAQESTPVVETPEAESPAPAPAENTVPTTPAAETPQAPVETTQTTEEPTIPVETDPVVPIEPVPVIDTPIVDVSVGV